MEKMTPVQLRDHCLSVVANSIDSEDKQMVMAVAGLSANVQLLPVTNKEVLDTFKGILGFKAFLEKEGKFENKSYFAMNAIHDLSNCVREWDAPWYCPRTSRYVSLCTL